MLKAYKYVFYKLYRFERCLFDPAPEYTALGLMILVQGMNIALLLAIAQRYTGVSLLPYISKLEALGIIILLGVPQYFFLVHGGRFRRILKRFSAESRRRSLLGGSAVGLYILFSIVLFIWSVSLVHG
jgi:hypothetical protein